MAIETLFRATGHIAPAQTAERAIGENRTPSTPAPGSRLAELLDRFTNAVANPQAETVGGFVETVAALRGELVMLAHHFRAERQLDPEPIDFEAIFPELPE